MITPAITVLGAVEGLKIATEGIEPYIEPIAIAILVAIFVIQSLGSGKIGALFGPITLVWFIAIATLGIAEIIRAPAVLGALSPHHAALFFMANGWHGFLVLGAVFPRRHRRRGTLCGHRTFRGKPIRLVWFAVVLPALMLNYLGQGALLLGDPSAASDPFFRLAPAWALYPLVALATAAAIIASQALITGAFSLTMQAVQLGYTPRLTIQHTSAAAQGQVYLPLVNWALLFSCIALVLGFKSSSALAAAYGVSITSTMLITTVLFYVIARHQWKWNPWLARFAAVIFLVVDLAFLVANFAKIVHGGWFPLVVAAAVFIVMSTWQRGRAILGRRMQESSLPLGTLLTSIREDPPHRVPGTAFFMSGNPSGTPIALLHNLKHNKVLHDTIVILNVRIDDVPHVPSGRTIQHRLPGRRLLANVAPLWLYGRP
jgi:KUP system potassium uptake protein